VAAVTNLVPARFSLNEVRFGGVFLHVVLILIFVLATEKLLALIQIRRESELRKQAYENLRKIGPAVHEGP